MWYLSFVFLFFSHQELNKIEGEGERGRLEGSEYLSSSSLSVVIEGGGSKTMPSLVVVLTIVCRSLRRSIVTIKMW